MISRAEGGTITSWKGKLDMTDWKREVLLPMTRHYSKYPYPKYGLFGSVRRRDTFIFSLEALWAHFNGERLRPSVEDRILLAGSGSFLPYPVALANPRPRIVALDLSPSSLSRARLHAFRHLALNIDYVAGDIMEPGDAPGPFRYIDSFGVLHCIPDFAAALRALEARLSQGGILRVMVYSRDGRAEVERIRAMCTDAGIRKPSQVRALARKDPLVSACLRNSFELGFDEGIADAFLIPFAKTFVVDEILQAVGTSGMRLIRFCHQGALPDKDREIARIRKLEAKRSFPTNLCFYLGKGTPDKPRNDWVELNPCLSILTMPLFLGKPRLPPKFGPENPLIDASERRFLQSFQKPRRLAALSSKEAKRAMFWIDRLVLMAWGD